MSLQRATEHKDLRALPRPTREPRIDECPNFTHYLPWGGVMEVVLCQRPVGHPGNHHGEFQGIPFDWEPPIIIDPLPGPVAEGGFR